jgi:hypothetical protein
VDQAVDVEVIKEPRDVEEDYCGATASTDGTFSLMNEAHCGVDG